MTLREKVENNITIWLLSALLTGFLSGFAAYKAILEVSGRANVSKAEIENLKRKESYIHELEAKIASLKSKEGKIPSAHHFNIAKRIVQNRPEEIVSTVHLDKKYYLSSKWIGLSADGFYEQKWEIFNVDGLVFQNRYPFIQKNEGDYWAWTPFKIDSRNNTTGKYRVRVFINGEKFEDRELVVAGK